MRVRECKRGAVLPGEIWGWIGGMTAQPVRKRRSDKCCLALAVAFFIAGMSRAHGFSPGKSCVVESLGATACTSPTVMQLGADLIFNLMIRNANEHLCTVSHECNVAASDITASLEGEQARAVTCDEGYCLIQFTDSITIAGETKLEISVGGSSISGSPYTIILTPADNGLLVESRTSISSEGGTVGESISSYIHMKDMFGNSIRNSSLSCADFLVDITSQGGIAEAEWACIPESQGSYHIIWGSTMAGLWTVSLTAGARFDSVVVTLSAGEINATLSRISQAAIPLAGQVGKLTITAYDRFSNLAANDAMKWEWFAVNFSAQDGGDSGVANLNLGNFSHAGAGLFEASFSTTRSGLFSLQVLVEGDLVTGKAISVSVKPNLVHGPAMHVPSQGFASLVSGIAHTFLVRGADRYGNRYSAGEINLLVDLSREGWGDTTQAGVVTVQQRMEGSAQCSITVTRSGTYSLLLQLASDGLSGAIDDNVISLSPYVLIAKAEETMPATSVSIERATASLSMTAGILSTFTMHELDSFGNVRSVSGQSFHVSLVLDRSSYSQAGDVTDIKGGAYHITFLPTVSGTYSISVSSALGSVIVENDMKVRVEPNAASFECTTVADLGTSYMWGDESVGRVNSFAVKAMDAWGNSISVGGSEADFTVDFRLCPETTFACNTIPVTSTDQLADPVLDLGNGFYGINFTFTVSGHYSANVMFQGKQVSGSPFDMVLHAGTTDPLASQPFGRRHLCSMVLVTFNLSDLVACGIASDSEEVKFSVRLVDEYGNQRYARATTEFIKFSTNYEPSPTPDHVGDLTNLTAASGVIAPSTSDGSYGISFVSKWSGRYLTTLKHVKCPDELCRADQLHGDIEISGSPAVFFVIPAAPYAPLSIAEGAGLSLATAGLESTFLLLTRDRFMNHHVGVVDVSKYDEVDWEVRIRWPDGQFSLGSVEGQTDGYFVCRFVVSLSGVYELTVLLDGKPISEELPETSGSPFQLFLHPGIASSASFVANTGMLSGRVDSAMRIRVQAADRFGNLRTTGGDLVEASLLSLPSAVFKVSDYSNGSYDLEIFVSRSGIYQADIRVWGIDVVGSPVVLNVTSGAMVPTCSEVSPSTLATAGVTAQFLITAKDTNYNKREEGGDDFDATCSALTTKRVVQCLVHDARNGMYTAFCILTQAGAYTVAVTALNSDGRYANISGSPFLLTAHPGVSRPEASAAFGAAMTRATAGVPGSFEILARDNFFNVQTKSSVSAFILTMFRKAFGQTVQVSACPSKEDLTKSALGSTGPLSTNGTCLSRGGPNGTSIMTYLQTVSGKYAMSVQIKADGEESSISNGDFELDVLPAETDTSTCTAFGTAYSIATVGSVMTFVVQTRDRFANLRSSTGGSFRALLKGPGDVLLEVPSVDQGDGSHVLAYVATASGAYLIEVESAGVSVKNSPRNLSISATIANPSSFTVSGPGIVDGCVGQSSSVILTTRDTFGNYRTEGGDDVRVTAVGGWLNARDGSTRPITEVFGDVHDLNNGLYNITFSTTHSGMYILSIGVQIGGDYVHAQGSPFSLKILPGSISALFSVHLSVSEGMVKLLNPTVEHRMTAGEWTTFLILAKDQYGNARTEGGEEDQFEVTMNINGDSVGCNVFYKEDYPGHYAVTYPATISGEYQVSSSFGGVTIQSHRVVVLPATTEARFVTAAFPEIQINDNWGFRHTTAGVKSTFLITLRDAFHNVRTLGGHDVSLTVSPIDTITKQRIPSFAGFLSQSLEDRKCDEACAIDNQDGTYIVSLSPTISGRYHVAVFLDGNPICQIGCSSNLHSPYNFTTTAAEVWPPLSLAYGLGLRGGVAGSAMTFTIHARDKFENNRTHGVYVVDGGVVLVLGEYFASQVQIGGALKTPELCSCESGLCTHCEPFNCKQIETCSMPAEGTPTVADHANGSYSVKFTVTQAGKYSVSVSRASLHLEGSPFTMVVSAGKTDPATTQIFGDGLYRATAGARATGKFQVRDSYFNVRTLGGDSFNVFAWSREKAHCSRPVPDGVCILCESGDTDCQSADVPTGYNKPLVIRGAVSHDTHGLYEFSYTATISGVYKLHIKHEGKEAGTRTFTRSPFTLSCAPGQLDPRASTVSGEGSTLATVEEEAFMFLEPRDVWGNDLSGSHDAVQVDICEEKSSCTREVGSMSRALVYLSFFHFSTGRTHDVTSKFSDVGEFTTINTGPSPVKVEARPHKGGSTIVLFTVRDIGKYRVGVEVHESGAGVFTPIRGSPFNVSVFPYDPEPSPLMCEVIGITQALAGTRATGVIALRNRYGIAIKSSARIGMIEATPSDSNPAPIDVSIVNRRDGTFLFACSVTSAGTYAMNIKTTDADGTFRDIPGSPVEILVVPDATEPRSCVALVSQLEAVVAGTTLTYAIRSRDRFGNEQLPGNEGDQYQSYIVPLRGGAAAPRTSAKLETVMTGALYSASFVNDVGSSMLTRSGMYQIVTKNLFVHTINSPQVILVRPDSLAPSRCILHTGELQEVTAGVYATVAVQARDRFDNDLTSGSATHGFMLIKDEVGPVSTELTFKTRYEVEGRTIASFLTTTKGLLTVRVLAKSVEILQSPFSVMVSPGVASARHTFNATAVPATGRAGELQAFMIQAADEFGNLHDRGGEILDFSVKGLMYLHTFMSGFRCSEISEDHDSCVTVKDKRDGQYLVEFKLKVAGDYIIEGVLHDQRGVTAEIGEHGARSPWLRCIECRNVDFPSRSCLRCFTLEVRPAAPALSHMTMYGIGAGAFTSGEEMEFLLLARDLFGNVQTSGGLNMTVSIVGGKSLSTIKTVVTDLCDSVVSKCGQYLVKYTGSLAGTYALSVELSEDVTYHTIEGFPASRADPVASGLPFLPSSALGCTDICTSGLCCLTGEGASFSQATRDTTFVIQARDKFGNDMTSGGEVFEADIAGPMQALCTVEDLETGQYMIKYKVLIPGTYVLSIRLRRVHIGIMYDSCPDKTVQCFKGSPNGELVIGQLGSGLEGLILKGASGEYIAGDMGIITVDASDRTAQRLFDRSPLVTELVAATESASVHHNTTVTPWTLSFNVQKAGIWKLAVSAGLLTHAVGSPFTVTVLPNKAVPSNTLVTDSGHRVAGLQARGGLVQGISGILDQKLRLYVIPRDKFFNERTHGKTMDNVRWHMKIAGTLEFLVSQSEAARRQIEGDQINQYVIEGVPSIGSNDANVGVEFNLVVWVGEAQSADLTAITEDPMVLMAYPYPVEVSSKKSIAYGAGLDACSAEKQITFTIEARDSNGARMTSGGANFVVFFKDQARVVRSALPADNEDGTYSVSEEIRVAAFGDSAYMLDIKLRGYSIALSPFALSVYPGAPSGSNTLCEAGFQWLRSDGLHSGVAASIAEFVLTLRDQFSNVVTKGIPVDQVKIKIVGVSHVNALVSEKYCTDPSRATAPTCQGLDFLTGVARSWHENDGSYRVHYAATSAGTYSIVVSVAGADLSESPWERAVRSTKADLVTSYAVGEALQRSTAGAQNYLTMFVRDKFGNSLDQQIMVSATLASSMSLEHCEVETISLYEYEVQYEVTRAGDYLLDLMVSGISLDSGPFRLSIYPAQTHFKSCIAHTSSLLPKAGSRSSFPVYAYDKFGNARTEGGDDFRASLSGPALVSADAYDWENGTYTVSFFLRISGAYVLSGFLGVDSFLYMPDLLCEPGDIHGTSSEPNSPIATELMVGTDTEVLVQTRDMYGSKVVKCDDPVVIDIVSVRTDSGVYMSYTGTSYDMNGRQQCVNGLHSLSISAPGTTSGITLSGLYLVSVKIADEHIFGSPFRTIVKAGISSPRGCTAEGKQLSVGGATAVRKSVAGVDESFTVHSRDEYGNRVQFDPFLPLDVFHVVLQQQGAACDTDGNPVDAFAYCILAKVSNNMDSTHSVRYTPTKADKFEVVVRLVRDEQYILISNSPFTTTVIPAEICVGRTQAVDVPEMIYANRFTTFKVVARDQFDNVISTPVSTFDAFYSRRDEQLTVESTSADVVINTADGSYEVGFTVTAAGRYHLDVTRGGIRILDSYFVIQVTPGDISYSQCTLDGGGSEGGIVGHDATFSIMARDTFGNQLTVGGYIFTVQIYKPDDSEMVDPLLEPVPIDNHDGSFSVTYKTEIEGMHKLRVVSASGEPVRNGIVSIPFMLDDKVSLPGRTIAVGPGTTACFVGELCGFKIQLRNYAGINRPHNDVRIDASLHLIADGAVLTVPVTIADEGRGVYAGLFSSDISGEYELGVRFQGEHIQGSPFTVRLYPSATDKVASLVLGGSFSSVVNQVVTFKIFAKDQFYNDQMYNAYDGADDFAVLLESGTLSYSFSASVVNNADGTYTVSYTTTRSSDYKMYATLRGELMSTWTGVVVAPEVVNTDACLIDASGLRSHDAGEVGSVLVHARDVYGNSVYGGLEAFNISINRPNGEQSHIGVARHCDSACVLSGACPCSELTMGVYGAHVSMTKAGKYQLLVDQNGIFLPGVPIDMSISASYVTTEKSTVDGCETVCDSHILACSTSSDICPPCSCPSLKSIQAGRSVTLTIRSRDRFGNAVSHGGKVFKVALTRPISQGAAGCYLSEGCASTLILFSLKDNDDGSYAAVLDGEALSVPGSYLLSVTRQDAQVYGSPFSFEVTPGRAASGDDSSEYTVTELATVGIHSTFTIFARDKFGNQLTTGGERFVVSMTGASLSIPGMTSSGSVEDDGDGTYFANFKVERAGTYILTVKLDGGIISPGTTTVAVIPGAVDPSMSSVDGTGLEDLQPAGDPAIEPHFVPPEIRAIPRDRFGNLYSFNGLPIRVSSSGPVDVVRHTSDTAFFTYVDCGVDCSEYLYLNPLTVSGEYKIDVLLDIMDQSGAVTSTVSLLPKPAKVKVIPSSTATERSTFSGPGATECVADKICSFRIQAFDAFGNMVDQQGDPFEVKLVRQDAFPESNVISVPSKSAFDMDTETFDGKYDVHYQVTHAGIYSLQVVRYGVNLDGSPGIVRIWPGDAQAETTDLEGFGTVSAVKGGSVLFTVVAKDFYGNIAPKPSILDLLRIDTNVGEDVLKILALSGGKYGVEFPVDDAGIWPVSILVGSQHIAVSPMIIEVQDSVSDSPNFRFCTVDDPLTGSVASILISTAGIPQTIRITPRNNAGDIVPLSGVKFEARLGDTTCSTCQSASSVLEPSDVTWCCVDNDVDPPAVRYSSLRAGTVQMDVTMYRPDLSNSHPHIFGSPFKVAIQPSATNAERTTVAPITLSTTNVSTAGFPSQFAIMAKDVYGNVQMYEPSAIDTVAISVSGPSHTNASVRDQADGTFLLAFAHTRAGQYRISIFVSGALVSAQSVLLTVEPDILFVRASTVEFGTWRYLTGDLTATAGMASVNMVQARDAYGNALVREQGNFNMNLTGRSITVVRTFRYSNHGIFKLEHAITASGQYFLSIFGVSECTSAFDCDHVTRSPFRLKVSAGIVEASNCAVYGPGVFFAIASSDARIFILPRDMYGNQVFQELSTKDFNMTLTSRAEATSSGLFQYSPLGTIEIVTDGVIGEFSTSGIQVTYTAPMPGSYEMVIWHNGEVIGGTNGRSCGSNKPCPVVAMSSPPSVTKCQFSDSGGHIYVHFNEQTNNASKSSSFPCDELFQAATVTTFAADTADARCTFLSTQLLDITLGFGASVRINDDLQWIDGKLKQRAVCLARHPLRVCFENSLALEGAVRVDRPGNPPRPTPILKAPGTVGPCDGVTLDASASYGSMGRPLQFYFGMMPGVSNDQQIRSYVLGQIRAPFTAASISLPAGLLQLGETYTFMVRVVNFMDISSTGTVTVEQRAINGPAVIIEGPNRLAVRSTQALRLRSKFALSSCVNGPEHVSLAWSYATDTVSSPFILNSITRETRTLFVEPLSLDPGVIYTFSVVASMRFNPTDTGVASVSVYCEYAPLVARIVGGERSVSATESFTLDASQSIDLDGIKSKITFGYKWSCKTPDGHECFDDVYGILSTGNDAVNIPPSILFPGVYLFTVEVSKEPGPRTSKATSFVFVMAAGQLDVQIQPLIALKVNSNERLVLSGNFNANELCPDADVRSNTSARNTRGSIVNASDGSISKQGLEIRWSQTEGGEVLLYPSLISTPVTLQHLAVRPDALVPGSLYRFRLVVSCVQPGLRRSGLGEIAIRVNTAPSSGQFTVSPSTGTGSDTSFLLEMLNWVDDKEDMPLSFEFRYSTSAEPNKEIPVGSVDSNWLETVLPGPLHGDASHIVTLIGYVADIYDGRVRAVSLVEVFRFLDDTALRASDPGKTLNSYIATGNIEGIIAMIISFASEGSLDCNKRDSMIDNLQAASRRLVMNKVEVAGFSSAIKSLQKAPCNGSPTATLSDESTGKALLLVESLAQRSIGAGLDRTANLEIANTLSGTLGEVAKKNLRRRMMRRVLDLVARQREFLAFSPMGAGLRSSKLPLFDPKSRADMLTRTVKTLQESQTVDAVRGEDAQSTDTDLIQMKARLSSPMALSGIELKAGGSSFMTPDSVFSETAGAGTSSVSLKAKNSNFAESPYDSDSDVGNVASCDLGTPIKGLRDPIGISMSSKSSSPISSTSVCLSGPQRGKLYKGTPISGCEESCGPLVSCELQAELECASELWNTCVNATVDSCRFWNLDQNDWDGEGCVVDAIEEGSGLQCHCYHLTDFGGAIDSLMPEMNFVDPSNPGALFKNISADKIFVISVICGMLLIYWSLCFWGWRQDKVDNYRTLESLSHQANAKERHRFPLATDANAAMLAGNNFKLIQGSVRGKLSRSIMMIKAKVTNLFATEHKLFGAFFSKRRHFTRPRRFTVLFCMIIGNMFISAVFAGTENSTFVTKVIMGVIAGIIMLPATFFFKLLFMLLDVDARTKERWEQEAVERARRQIAGLATTLTVGPTHAGVAAPPMHLHSEHHVRVQRGFVPYPESIRMDNSIVFSPGRAFRRRPTRRTVRDSCEGLPAAPSLFSPAIDSISSSAKSMDVPVNEVGSYIPRRALPVRKGVRPPAPLVVVPRSVFDDRAVNGGSLEAESKPYRGTVSLAPEITSEIETQMTHQRLSDTTMRCEIERLENTIHPAMQPIEDGLSLKGRTRLELSIANKLVSKLTVQQRERTATHKKVRLNYNLQYGAYCVAFLWYTTCCYFCVLYGLTFTTDIEQAWLISFFISVLQDLLVSETIVIAWKTAVGALIFPNIAAFLADRIARKYK